ncbi:nuclear fragile X mental retardation-interacting protein 1-domain-containing protein [Dichomitus squalens]|uniref:Nuclear fragile X mental retardation-interacting protein 1-domain-containing protein n=1 Tax=Dichomitus squalens TaxID=114155 RepID=A0A4Q9N1Y5_9APHY|nr:nuclear fragile X mental retardation-interacting protein 1-domain-containing protein [Dichomitus squalens]
MQPNRPQAHQGVPYYSAHAGPSSANIAAQAVTAALSNPYGQTQFGAYGQAAHYAQAYAQYYNQAGPSVTAEGYTISSTYVPGTNYNQRNPPHNARPNAPQRPPMHGHGGGQGPGGWYQPGTSRCSQQGCSFTGSKKSVELHTMDRHLIYPPGWDHRKKRNDWDADPSLKGKPVPIQGTSLRLDTPEAIAAWIAERKKRFPTAQNVAEKEQKKREAVQRETDNQGIPGGEGGSEGGDEAEAGAGQDGAGAPIATEASTGSPTGVAAAATQRPEEDVSSSSDSDSDSAPEVVSSKAPPGVEAHEAHDMIMDVDDSGEEEAREDVETQERAPSVPEPVKKPRPKQPRRTPRNPFAQRQSLLRNLLLPEIRMTVSNLSQAIRFLVDNDFLDNVELKPGQANERMIEVIGDQPTVTDDPIVGNAMLDEPAAYSVAQDIIEK